MHTYRWIPESGIGLEHLTISRHGQSITAQGLVIGGGGDAGLETGFEAGFGASYVLSCDAAWRVRHATIGVAGGGRLELFADGEGHWRKADGTPLDALAGCIDIDLSASCFTNTLPIRRLGDALGERQEIAVAYVSIPGVTVETARQAYTRCARNLYRFESVDTGFQADLTVDDDGFVLHYPGLFRRAEPLAPPG
ncbi:putative glycolipid-binding domain-containing protein [Massilia niabensis]|uniref:Glycolipid-binding domain-containing protein n=1 Tax=Massilia niabensis TaxID=544910 RepID=A0ABW0L130_9BURK